MFCLQKALHRLKTYKIENIQHQDYVSKFIALLVHASEKSIYQKCLEFLMIDVYKYLNGLPSHIMNDIFRLIENTYNPRNFHLFENQNPRTKQYGLDRIA